MKWLSVPAKVLKALNIFADKNYVRPVLRHISVKRTGDNIVLAATDSYRVMTVTFKCADDAIADGEELLFPASLVKELKLGKNADVIVTWDDDGNVILASGYISLTERLDDGLGNYPEYEQVMPSESPSEASMAVLSVKPKYLEELAAAAGMLADKDAGMKLSFVNGAVGGKRIYAEMDTGDYKVRAIVVGIRDAR